MISSRLPLFFLLPFSFAFSPVPHPLFSCFTTQMTSGVFSFIQLVYSIPLLEKIDFIGFLFLGLSLETILYLKDFFLLSVDSS
jgi:hypothetical protein